jgi:hypothetical protein
MQKRISKKVDTYIVSLKEDFKKKLIELNFNEKEKINMFLEYLNEYEKLTIQEEDLTKRNRLLNEVPETNRCNAKLYNGEKCNRRKKKNVHFCGSHCKNTPFGSIESTQIPTINVNVFTIYIKGIIYYIDDSKNVYKTEDILEGKQNPQIIAKATFENEQYHIPEFNI